jgi:hypothetical protein
MYEDTQQLKEKYIDDLQNQKDKLKSILRYQNVDVSDNEGMESMVNKVKDVEGTPVLPYYSFAYCESNAIRNMLKDINFASTKKFSGMFLGWYNVDLSSMNTMNGEIFNNFIVTPSASETVRLSIKFGENNDFSKAKNMDSFIKSGGGSWGTEISIDSKNLKHQIIEGPVSLNAFFWGVRIEGTWDKDHSRAENIMECLNKFEFKHVTSLNNFFGYNYAIRSYNDTEEIDYYSSVISSLFKNIETKYITSALSLFDYSDFDYLRFEPDYEKEWDELLNFNNWFNYYTRVTKIDLSKWTFKKVTEWYDIAMWGEYLEEVHMGTNPNPTLTRIVDCFGWGRAKKMDFSGWNFGALTSMSRNWYNTGSQLKEIYWGYDYGKGFTATTTGNRGYELDFSSYPLIYESAIQIINSLYDLKKAYKDNLGIDTYYKQYLRLKSTTKALLTAEEIAIATNKGWIVY